MIRKVIKITSNSVYLSAAWRSRVKDSGLHFTGQRRIHRQDDEFRDIWPQGFHSLVKDLTGCVDLFLTSQKDQDVTWSKASKY